MGRGNSHNLPSVKKIALSERYPKARLFAVLFLALAGAAALTYAVMSYLRVDSGWQTIEVSSAADTNCGSAFTLQYNLGQGGTSVSAEHKAVQALYTELCVTAYRLFDEVQEFEDIHNMCYLNQHPNEVIEVDGALYRAFETLDDCGSRWLYLAPVYAEYGNLFSCGDDSETVSYDPYQSAEVAEYFAEVAVFAQDPGQINLELLGDNRVRLFVSEAYLAYAEEIGFTSFIDFFSLKNAFMIDYLAEGLLAAGFSAGYLASYDGFIRNLDESGEVYACQLYDRVGQHVYPAAVMQMRGAVSIVSLRNYMLNDMDAQHYYEFADGEIRFPYIDTADGLCKSAVNDLTGYAYGGTCAEAALRMMPLYTADVLDEAALESLSREGIYCVYGKGDHVLYYNDPNLVLDGLYEKDGVSYRAKLR